MPTLLISMFKLGRTSIEKYSTEELGSDWDGIAILHLPTKGDMAARIYGKEDESAMEKARRALTFAVGEKLYLAEVLERSPRDVMLGKSGLGDFLDTFLDETHSPYTKGEYTEPEKERIQRLSGGCPIKIMAACRYRDGDISHVEEDEKCEGLASILEKSAFGMHSLVRSRKVYTAEGLRQEWSEEREELFVHVDRDDITEYPYAVSDDFYPERDTTALIVKYRKIVDIFNYLFRGFEMCSFGEDRASEYVAGSRDSSEHMKKVAVDGVGFIERVCRMVTIGGVVNIFLRSDSTDSHIKGGYMHCAISRMPFIPDDCDLTFDTHADRNPVTACVVYHKERVAETRLESFRKTLDAYSISYTFIQERERIPGEYQSFTSCKEGDAHEALAYHIAQEISTDIIWKSMIFTLNYVNTWDNAVSTVSAIRCYGPRRNDILNFWVENYRVRGRILEGVRRSIPIHHIGTHREVEFKEGPIYRLRIICFLMG